MPAPALKQRQCQARRTQRHWQCQPAQCSRSRAPSRGRPASRSQPRNHGRILPRRPRGWRRDPQMAGPAAEAQRRCRAAAQGGFTGAPHADDDDGSRAAAVARRRASGAPPPAGERGRQRQYAEARGRQLAAHRWRPLVAASQVEQKQGATKDRSRGVCENRKSRK